ncbi:MAG: PASTA domain-containing protein [Acidobacteriota bacterium]|jgi:outer membrane biosynthesis protein TonB|nr:PASTA domain-containing protein [Acidobacteriota bacterium]
MGLVKTGISAIGKLLIVIALAGTFLVGMAGVFYMSLVGDEVEIPKVVGKNLNDGKEELEDLGLRIKNIASRYSNEKPNTILEQRPKAGTTGKTGLMISVIVSQANPDGNEAPVDVEDKEKEAKKKEEEIKELPELETEKAKDKPKKSDKKTTPKTRDVIKEKKKEDTKDTEDKSKDSNSKESKKSADDKKDSDKSDAKSGTEKTIPPPPPKPSNEKPAKTDEKPKNPGDTRPRKVPPSN